MSDSTSLLDLISTGQASKEVTANATDDAESPAAAFARRATTSSGLTWGVHGAHGWRVDGVHTPKTNTTITLTASQTGYAEVDRSGVVSYSLTKTAGKRQAYEIVTGSSSATSWKDLRPYKLFKGRLSKALSDANYTLTADECLNDIIEFTGTLTASRNVIVPAVAEIWEVYNGTTGGFDIVVKTSGGTGVTVPAGSRAHVYCDGTNVVSSGGGSSLPVVDTTEIVKGSADATKKMRFDVGGFTTGTTRTFTMPDANTTLAGTDVGNTFTVGQTISSGTLTANAPILTGTQTWNNAGVTFKAHTVAITDTASASGSLLAEYSVGGVTKFQVNKAGWIEKTPRAYFGDISVGVCAILDPTLNAVAGFLEGFGAGINGCALEGSKVLSWTEPGSPIGNAGDLILRRDAANTLAQRNGTNAQGKRLYNTFTDASNYERFACNWASNVLTLVNEAAGTGTLRTFNLGASGKGNVGKMYLDYTNTATVGNVTINKAAGRVNMAAAASTLTVTDSLVTANSVIVLTLAGDPGNAVAVDLFAVASAGSFTVNTVPAVTNQTAINFMVISTD